MEKEINKTNVTSCDNIQLHKEQKALFNIMEYSLYNMLITGYAGTGKSTLLDYFVKNTTKNVIKLAPTGVAALNIQGYTLHSFFRFGWGILDAEEIRKKFYEHVNDLLKRADTIIIDEISMVTPDMIEAINEICKRLKQSSLPFGGIQIICFGDLYQLPPVISDKEIYRCLQDIYGGTFFFNAPVLKENPLKVYELKQIFRQKDSRFQDLLNKIRIGDNSKEIIDKINSRVQKPDIKDTYITLSTTRLSVDNINRTKLKELNSKEYVYTAKVNGNMKENSYPTEYELTLKEGAQIMMVANDGEGRWVNGTLGKITKLSPDSITVKIDGIEYPIGRKTWKSYKYEYDTSIKKIVQEVDGEFTQFPLKLAWAVTIHKAQSKTFQSVLVDFGTGAFTYGQVYVALSRCVSLDKLYLKNKIKPEDIKVNPEVVKFMENNEPLNLNDIEEGDDEEW